MGESWDKRVMGLGVEVVLEDMKSLGVWVWLDEEIGVFDMVVV